MVGLDRRELEQVCLERAEMWFEILHLRSDQTRYELW